MLNIHGFAPVSFNFDSEKDSTRTATEGFSVAGATQVEIFLQSFNLEYSDNGQYGFGELAITLTAVSTQSAQCIVTVRDNTTDQRPWSGTVDAIVIGYTGS